MNTDYDCVYCDWCHINITEQVECAWARQEEWNDQFLVLCPECGRTINVKAVRLKRDHYNFKTWKHFA